MAINLNKVAQSVSVQEGGVHNLSIAQIKEVMKWYNTILAQDYKASEVLAMIEKYE